jgi:hypothetical protein
MVFLQQFYFGQLPYSLHVSLVANCSIPLATGREWEIVQ